MDLRLVPVAAAAWIAAWIATCQQGWLIGLGCGAAGLLIVVALWRRGWVWLASGLVLMTLLGTGAVRSVALHDSPVAQLADQSASVEAVVRITGDPRQVGRGFSEMVVATGHSVEVVGRGHRWAVAAPVLVTASGERGLSLARVIVGSHVRVQGRLATPDPGSDLAAVLRVQSIAVERPPGPGWRLIERVRAGLRQSVAGRPDEPRALVPALVVGDMQAMTPELRADFQATALTHLTAVSGANLTLLLGFLLVLARWLGVRGRGLTVVALLGVVAFIALCRSEPSVLRAAAMGVVALAALGHGGAGVKGARHLCVAVIALVIIDPWLSRSIGFMLSVFASAGIIGWARAWADRLRWLPRVVAEGMAVPLAAQIATQPVVTAISGQVSIVGLLANGLAGPLVGPATVAGFAAAGLSLLHPAPAALAGWVASWAAQGIIWVAHVSAASPGASIAWPATPSGVAVLVAACVLAAWWIPRVLSRWWLTVLLALIISLGLLRVPGQPGWPIRDWMMVMCDVGTGDAAVVSLGRGRAIVIDTGGDVERMDRCLDQLHIEVVELAVLTHFHADHVGGAAALWRGRITRQIIVSPVASPASAAEQVRSLAAQHGTPVQTTVAGESFTVGTAHWQSYWPRAEAPVWVGADSGGESSAENDASVVGRLSLHGIRILFTGDVEPDAQSAIVASGVDLSADVLKVPHHGSSRQDRAFLAATGARVAITSSELGNSYRHPAPRTVALLESLDMHVLRTDQQGAISIAVGRDGLHARVQKSCQTSPC